MLLNHYKCMPISYPAKIIHTRENSIIILTHELQNSAAIIEGKCYVLSNKYIDCDYTVTVKPLEIKNKRVLELKGFDKLQNGITKRNDLRVHVPEGISIKLKYQEKTFNVALFDFSFGGLSVITAHKINAAKYSIFKIILSDIVPIFEELETSLMHVSTFEGAFKYHFKINFSIKHENIVTDYITKLQKEIIKELKNVNVS